MDVDVKDIRIVENWFNEIAIPLTVLDPQRPH